MKPHAKTALVLALAIVGGIAAGMRCDASEWVENSSQTNPRPAAYTVKAYTEGADPFIPICGICHDRFIIVDQKEIFWTGASLKDAGRLTFAAAKMGAEVIPGLLDSIRKATSESVAYPTDKSAASRSRRSGRVEKRQE